MALTAFMASVNDGSAKARTPRSNGSGAGGASAGRSATAIAMSAVKMAARIDTTAPQPSQVSLPNVRSDAGTKTMAAEMATQPAVHIACSETALKAVEMVRRAEPATKVQTARRRARERTSVDRSPPPRRKRRLGRTEPVGDAKELAAPLAEHQGAAVRDRVCREGREGELHALEEQEGREGERAATHTLAGASA